MTDAPPGRGSRMLECGAAAVLLIWRAAVLSPSALPVDAVFLLALYWIYTAFASGSRAWPFVTAATMLALGAIYVHGQFPHTLASLGLGS